VRGLLRKHNIDIFCFNDKHAKTTLHLLAIMYPISGTTIICQH